MALPRKNPKIKKKYFYIATENGASKEFVKFVFHEPGHDNGPFLIQYIGNEEVSPQALEVTLVTQKASDLR